MKGRIKDYNSGESSKGVTRRHFVKLAGITAIGVSSIGFSKFFAGGVSIITDPADLVGGSLPVSVGIEGAGGLTANLVGFFDPETCH